MRLLDAMPEVEKTSLFGTAVHAVLRDAASTPTRLPRGCAPAGVDVDEPSIAVAPSLEDVFLDVVERAARRDDAQGDRGLPQGVAADLARSPDAADPAVRAGVLPAALRLRAELGHPPRRARRRRIATARAESRALVSAFVNSGYFDRVGRRRLARGDSTGCWIATTARAVLVIPDGFGRDLRTGSPRRCRCSSTATTPTPRRPSWATRQHRPQRSARR